MRHPATGKGRGREAALSSAERCVCDLCVVQWQLSNGTAGNEDVTGSSSCRGWLVYILTFLLLLLLLYDTLLCDGLLVP